MQTLILSSEKGNKNVLHSVSGGGKKHIKEEGRDKMLSAKQRSQLKSKANPIKPLVFIGKEGVTENVAKEAETSLYHNELIKVAVQKGYEGTPQEAAEKLCGILGCETVQILGSKITLYKRTDKKDFEHLLTP